MRISATAARRGSDSARLSDVIDSGMGNAEVRSLRPTGNMSVVLASVNYHIRIPSSATAASTSSVAAESPRRRSPCLPRQLEIRRDRKDYAVAVVVLVVGLPVQFQRHVLFRAEVQSEGVAGFVARIEIDVIEAEDCGEDGIRELRYGSGQKVMPDLTIEAELLPSGERITGSSRRE